MSMRRLAPTEHLEWLGENYDTVLGVPPDLWSAPVEDCPGWQVDTVIDHLARAALAFSMYMT
jgi:hypothetical protein